MRKKVIYERLSAAEQSVKDLLKENKKIKETSDFQNKMVQVLFTVPNQDQFEDNEEYLEHTLAMSALETAHTLIIQNRHGDTMKFGYTPVDEIRGHIGLFYAHNKLDKIENQNHKPLKDHLVHLQEQLDKECKRTKRLELKNESLCGTLRTSERLIFEKDEILKEYKETVIKDSQTIKALEKLLEKEEENGH